MVVDLDLGAPVSQRIHQGARIGEIDEDHATTGRVSRDRLAVIHGAIFRFIAEHRPDGPCRGEPIRARIMIQNQVVVIEHQRLHQD